MTPEGPPVEESANDRRVEGSGLGRMLRRMTRGEYDTAPPR